MIGSSPPRRASSAADLGDALPLAIGDVVDGKYRVEGVIGRGGMGVVFAATHIALGHRVALKIVFGGGADQAHFVARFEVEARAVALMTSPHVARVYDVGHLDAVTPYMVMELLVGETLSTRIRRSRLATTEVASIVREICDALSEAHALGIIHRDLKGDNVFLASRPNGQVSAKLLDFGISKVTNTAVTGHNEPVTNARTILGTPSTMAPEQFTGGAEVTAKTDVWSLGVLLYKMLTGSSPFQAPSMFETAEKVVRGPTPTLSARRPDLHAAWTGLLEAMLQKAAADRPSLDEVLRRLRECEQLENAVDPEGGASRSAGAASDPPMAVTSTLPVLAAEGPTHTALITGASGGSSPSGFSGLSASGSRPRTGPHLPGAAPEVVLAASVHARRSRAKIALVLSTIALLVVGGAGTMVFTKRFHMMGQHDTRGPASSESQAAGGGPPPGASSADDAPRVSPVIATASSAADGPSSLDAGAPSVAAPPAASAPARATAAAPTPPRPRSPASVSPARSANGGTRDVLAPAAGAKPKPLTNER